MAADAVIIEKRKIIIAILKSSSIAVDIQFQLNKKIQTILWFWISEKELQLNS